MSNEELQDAIESAFEKLTFPRPDGWRKSAIEASDILGEILVRCERYECQMELFGKPTLYRKIN